MKKVTPLPAPGPGPIRRLLEDPFARQGALLFFIGNAGSAANYLFQILTNRSLSKSDYGFLNALFSTSILVGLLGDTLRLWMIKRFGEARARGSGTAVRGLYLKFTGVTLLVLGVVLLLSWVVLSPGVGQPLFWTSLVCFSVLAFASITPMALLDSFERFGRRSWAGTAGVGMKIALAGGLTFFGALGLQGALASFAAGALLTFLLLLLFVRAPLRELPDGDPAGAVLSLKEGGHFFWLSLSSLTLTLAMQIDMPIARTILGNEGSGDYATANVFGRTVFLLCAPLLSLFFVAVHRARETGQDDRPVLLKSLVFLTIVAGAGTLLLALFLKPFVHLLNPAYTRAVPEILFAAVATLPYLALHFLATYFVSVGRYAVFLWLLALLALQALWLRYGADTVHGMLVIRLASGGALVTVALVAFLLERQSIRREANP